MASVAGTTRLNPSEVFMKLNKVLKLSRGLRTGVNVIVGVAALIVIGYGIGLTPERMLLLSNEVSAFAYEGQMSNPVSNEDSTKAVSPAHEPQANATDVRNERIDPSRECNPDKGIVDACIYE